MDLRSNNCNSSSREGHPKQRTSSQLVDSAHTNANGIANGKSDANITTNSNGRGTGNNQKSLIESESPQIPMFFSKGKFSQRRRMMYV